MILQVQYQRKPGSTDIIFLSLMFVLEDRGQDPGGVFIVVLQLEGIAAPVVHLRGAGTFRESVALKTVMASVEPAVVYLTKEVIHNGRFAIIMRKICH